MKTIGGRSVYEGVGAVAQAVSMAVDTSPRARMVRRDCMFRSWLGSK
jgi:hypothetical protein